MRRILTLRSDPDRDIPNNRRLSNLEHFQEVERRRNIPHPLWIPDRPP